MKDKSDIPGTRELRKGMLIQSIVIVIASVMAFEFLEYYLNVMRNNNVPTYAPILGIGMIVPMGLLMGLLSYNSMKATNRFIARLVSGITKVADGDFGSRLDTAKSGPYKDVFIKFNKMSAELQGVQTLRDDFINQFSHEFKTPITSINGFAKLLLEEEVSEEDKREYLGIIATESERLADLSNSTLLLAKLESQQYVLDKEPYPLDEQIKQCVILLAAQWGKKQLDLSADLEPATYNGNADLMKQVWINLLSNAIKFTPEHGEIAVSLKRGQGAIVVTVADSGKGMTGEEMSRAFEKYYQGASVRSSKGLGLGLAIVKKIVELCDGRIDVQSSPGDGSAFAVTLPS
jgi:signal transduction histidine kinase